MTTLKFALYCLVVVGLAGGGVIDFAQCQPRQGIIALLFATANALIFFWR